MTVEKLIEIIKDYPTYAILSDSGWECCATDMDGLWINHKDKEIVVTQYLSDLDTYCGKENWQPLGGIYVVTNLLQGGTEEYEYTGGDLEEVIAAKRAELVKGGR